MKVLVACVRGNIAERDKWGHCLCPDCKKYNYNRQKKNRPEGYLKDWQRNNKDKVKEYFQKWVAKNKEQRKAIVDSWRKRNPEKVKAMSNKAGKKWAKNNAAAKNAITAKRRAAILNQTPQWADQEKIKQFYVEAERRTKESGIKHEVDHIIPLQGKNVSGLHVHYNLQILTRSKNRSKRNKMEDKSCACS